MILPDALVLLALRRGLLAIAANPAVCEEFLLTYAGYDPVQFQQALSWFADHAQTLPLVPGWPTEPPPPGAVVVGVTLGAQAESTQWIGSNGEQVTDVDATGTVIAIHDTAVTMMGDRVDITVYSANYNLCQVVAAACCWALLKQRIPLENAGIAEQRLSLGDLTPDQRFAPDYVYRRVVTLSGQSPAMVQDVATDFLRTVNVYAIDDASPDGAPELIP